MKIRLTDAQECLVNFDDPLMERYHPREVVRQGKGWTLYEMSVEIVARLLDDARDRQSAGWDYDNPGAAISAARALERTCQAVLIAAVKEPL